MEGKKDIEKSVEAVDTSVKPDSVAILTKQDVGIQPSNGSLTDRQPGGYDPYASSWKLIDVDGQCVGQHPYSPYSGDSTSLVGDSKPKVSTPARAALLKLKYVTKAKRVNSNTSMTSLDSNTRVSTGYCNLSNHALQSQHLKPLNQEPKLHASEGSAGLAEGNYPIGKFSQFSDQGQSRHLPQNGPTNFRLSDPTWRVKDGVRMKEKYNRNEEYEYSTLSHGPRATRVNAPSSSPAEKDSLIPLIQKDKYNLQDFQTNYEQAKFFVIKSDNEDDVHKSIKYNAWASTPSGNEKLDAVFHDAETRSIEKGTRCPIFLFFSVHKSGQFVGLAEMTGQVDFKKSLDFWLVEKWDGFFPVKWHIIKDIPNAHLQHIILKNNDKQLVPYAMDTKEIQLPQGLEMLNIFKNYPSKTSILDDFKFYEDRQKALHARRNNRPASRHSELNSYKKSLKDFKGKVETVGGSRRAQKTYNDVKPSFINLTKNLTLNH